MLGFPLMQCIDINDSETVQELLGTHMSTQHAKALAVHLASGTRTHDYPISAAQSLSVGTAVPKEVYAFTLLFPSRRGPVSRSNMSRCPMAGAGGKAAAERSCRSSGQPSCRCSWR